MLSKILFSLIIFASAPTFSFASTAYQVERIPKFAMVDEGVYRGGRPQRGDLSWIKNSVGIRMIVNIENNWDAIRAERDEANRLGLGFVSIPMNWDETPNDDDINQILEIMRDSSAPVFVHCFHGEDRTGLVVALYRVLVQGWEPNRAYEEMLENGFNPKYEEMIAYFWKRTSR